MLTAVYVEAEDGSIVGYIEEIQGVHTQGRTMGEPASGFGMCSR